MRKLSEVDFEEIERQAEGLLPLEKELAGAIGTAGEKEARKRLTAAIQELNMVLEGDVAVNAVKMMINSDFNNV